MCKTHLLPEWTRPEILYLWDPQLSVYKNNKKINLLYQELREFLGSIHLPYIVLGREHFPQGVPHRHIEIWMKDWAPLQSEEGLEWFRFHPSYLPWHRRDKRPESMPSSDSADTRHNLILDGGNFIHNGNGTAILTRRVLSENRGISESSLLQYFRGRFSIHRLILIDEEPEDEFGHIDAILRFAAPNILLYSSLSEEHREFPQWQYRQDLIKKLQSDLPDIHLFPIFDSFREVNGTVDTLNLNFIRWGEMFILPGKGGPWHERNKQTLESLNPDWGVWSFGSTYLPALIREGGSLNCISWIRYKNN